MIQKLRKKFIMVNMALVSLVLLIVFAALGFSTLKQAEMQTKEALDRAVMIKEDEPAPRPKIGPMDHPEPFSMIPAFTITVDEDGNVVSKNLMRVEIEEDVILNAVRIVLGSGRQDGLISSLNLRYLARNFSGGTRIAFADTTNENAAAARWLFSSLLIGLGGLGAFFVISLFLSRWALKPVSAAWEQQRQFVADASHELKTPLTVILANVGILLRHKDETVGQQQKWVEYTKEEAERMKKLVDEMLFLAKSDAARTPVSLLPLNFSDVVWNSVLPFESVAFELHVTLESHITPDVCLQGDEGQLKQLVAILLDNACKYAVECGKVTVSLDKGQDKVRLTVHNTGTPIPSDQLPRIFDRFIRADSSRARSQGGYGLGLAIAKTIVEGHKGKITAESCAAEGTIFTVILPQKVK
jgi:two-component system, OmpR family, sensor histidine kinase CiaH